MIRIVKSKTSFYFLIELLMLSSACLVIAEAKKPNVMIIFADDVGTGDVPGYWDTSKVDMPNLEAFVANGTTFTDAHSTPLCAASRYTLLSGNYEHRGTSFNGMWVPNYNFGSQFRDRQQSMAQVFRDNGYHTSMYGKWHLGGKVLGSFTLSQYLFIFLKILQSDFSIELA
jgi:arylsulfatase A